MKRNGVEQWFLTGDKYPSPFIFVKKKVSILLALIARFH
jgi:hypothetical protein